MGYRTRIYYTEKDKALMWERLAQRRFTQRDCTGLRSQTFIGSRDLCADWTHPTSTPRTCCTCTQFAGA